MKGMAWAAETPPAETDLDELLTRPAKLSFEAKTSRGSAE
jgi:hypothetical protein